MRTFLIIILSLLVACNNLPEQGFANKAEARNTISPIDSVIKIEMNLSALGVESDDFPSIEATIDFENYSSECKRSFYNPQYKGSIYSLDKNEIKNILKALQNSNLEKEEKEYKALKSDQATSTTIIYTKTQKYTIVDYGLIGDSTLQELYKIVYKL